MAEALSRLIPNADSCVISVIRHRHANGEMSGRYGKQLLDNVQWRQECAAKVGLGFVLPTNKQPMIDKSGQVLRVEEHEAVAV